MTFLKNILVYYAFFSNRLITMVNVSLVLEIMAEERRTGDIDTTATDHSCGHRCHEVLPMS
jgi:hypothetical protein